MLCPQCCAPTMHAGGDRRECAECGLSGPEATLEVLENWRRLLDQADEGGVIAELRGRIAFLTAQNAELRAEAQRLTARANELPGLTAELAELRHQRVDLGVQLRAMVDAWDEAGDPGGTCRTDVLRLAAGFDQRDVASMFNYERAAYVRAREELTARLADAMSQWRRHCPCACAACQALDKASRGGHG